MKQILTTLAMVLLTVGVCLGGTVTGFVSDDNCARSGEAANPECAKKCISSGAKAVLVAADGKIYSVAQQDKLKEFAGETVAVTGKIEGSEIKSIDSAVVCSDSSPCKS